MSSFIPGHRFAGRYLLVRSLDDGAQCWLVEDTEARERRVLKLAAGAAARALLRAEAALLVACAHPGVVRSFATCEADGVGALVLEYLPGGDLGALRGRPWREVLSVLEPALAGLEHVHAQGRAHGDLKPANLVRGADGGARLVDFGVGVGGGRGSPYSRSPAQWNGAAPAAADDAYGLGALLYELCSGAPPFYPDAEAARAATAPPPPLPASLPAGLVALVTRLLARDPGARGTIAAARAALATLTSAVPPVPPAPSIVLAPPARPLAGTAWQPAAPAPIAGAEPRSRTLPWLGGGFVLALVLVFVLLPRWVREHPPEVTVAPPPAVVTPPVVAANAPKPLPTTPEGLAALAEAKTRAEDARGRFSAVRDPLLAAHAELWGGGDWQRLEAAAADAARQYEQRDYTAAAATWTLAAEIARHVAGARTAALAAALAAGRAALSRGESAAAVAAFERAQAIEPASREATAGLGRARHLDEVQALLDAAATLEKDGAAEGAADKYRAALALDPAAGAANAGLARLAARARSGAFAQAMAQGQKALAAGDRDAARAAFGRAAALQPEAPALHDALAALDSGERSATLARLRASAEAAVRAERWDDAVKDFDAALAVDPTLLFAQEGRAAAGPRAALAARIAAFLGAPDRLHSPEGRAAARAALAAAAGPARGAAPVLRQSVAELEAALAVAETPVHVVLSSDGATDVVVYRVGKLGAFATRELELLPGRYTIVGRRAGFRDVRREVEVGPAPTAPVDIRCNESI